MELKKQEYHYGDHTQITVILAANIIPVSVRYMKTKICLVSESS